MASACRWFNYYNSKLRGSSSFCPFPSNREMFTFLNFIFNRVSKSRLAEVGPDRACAEWLMRNGAFIRWHGDKSFVPGYNALPLDSKVKGDFRIAEVLADNASIDRHGFPHFHGCSKVEGIRMRNCLTVDDRCLEYLTILKDSLYRLEIVKCNEISDKGLLTLAKLQNLKSLRLGELLSVEDLNGAVANLKKSLPSCIIEIIKDSDLPSGEHPGRGFTSL